MRILVLLASAYALVHAQDCATAPEFPTGGTAEIIVNSTRSWRFSGAAGETAILRATGIASLSRFAGSTVTLTLTGPTGGLVTSGIASPVSHGVTPVLWLPMNGAIILPATGSYCLTASLLPTSTFNYFPGTGIVSVQRSSLCTASLFTQQSTNFPLTGGTVVLDAVVSPGCSFAPVAPEWLQVTPAVLQGGHNSLILNAGVWTGQSRAGAVNLGAASVSVSQAGGATPGCSYSLATTQAGAPAEGSEGSVNLNVIGANCSWAAAGPSRWFGVYPLSGQTSTGTVPITWNAAPNFSTQARTTTVSIAGQTLNILQQANTLSIDRRFIQLMYWSFFGRLPAQWELDFHANSGLNRIDMALNFWNSDEFFTGGRFIAGLYVGLLDRNPEFTGWAFQRRALAGRIVTSDQLVSNFLAGPEYAARFGALTNTDFVRQMYRQVLFREAADEEVTFYEGVLLGGASRPAVARTFLGSTEFRISTAKRLTILLLYFTLLQRDPLSADTGWVDQLIASGFDTRALIAAVLNSIEFQASL